MGIFVADSLADPTGTRISSTPSAWVAVMLFASTPGGRMKLREKLP
jgi:hypothetical protein